MELEKLIKKHLGVFDQKEAEQGVFIHKEDRVYLLRRKENENFTRIIATLKISARQLFVYDEFGIAKDMKFI